MDSLPENIGRAIERATRNGGCPAHGPYLSTNIVGRIWSQCPECNAERAAHEAEQAAQERRRMDDERHQRQLDAVRIPERFTRCTFDGFIADTDAKRHALSVLRDYAERFDEHMRTGASLVLSGRPGTGKSHLAGAVLRALCDRTVRYITCLDLIRAVRDTWRRDSERSETQLLDYLESLDLLAIDELGMQYGTDGEQTVIFDVLDRRYRQMRPVILCTNQDRDGLKAFVGERVFDRLRETARWVPFDWDSYRAQARVKAGSA